MSLSKTLLSEQVLSLDQLNEIKEDQQKILQIISVIGSSIEFENLTSQNDISTEILFKNIIQILNFVGIPIILYLTEYKQFFQNLELILKKLAIKSKDSTKIKYCIIPLSQIFQIIFDKFKLLITKQQEIGEINEINQFQKMHKTYQQIFKSIQEENSSIFNNANEDDIMRYQNVNQSEDLYNRNYQPQIGFELLSNEAGKVFEKIYIKLLYKFKLIQKQISAIQYSDEQNKNEIIAQYYEKLRKLQSNTKHQSNFSTAERNLIFTFNSQINEFKVIQIYIQQLQLIFRLNQETYFQIQQSFCHKDKVIKIIQDLDNNFFLKKSQILKKICKQNLKIIGSHLQMNNFKKYQCKFVHFQMPKEEEYFLVLIFLLIIIINLGIRDQDCQVIGISLTKKQKDDIKLAIDVGCELQKFDPRVEENEVRTYFIPVLNPDTKLHELGKYVIKTVVKKGKPNELYIMPNGSSYIRRDGRKEKLGIHNMKQEIIKRFQIQFKEQEHNDKMKQLYDDPQPKKSNEIYEDFYSIPIDYPQQQKHYVKSKQKEIQFQQQDKQQDKQNEIKRKIMKKEDFQNSKDPTNKQLNKKCLFINFYKKQELQNFNILIQLFIEQIDEMGLTFLDYQKDDNQRFLFIQFDQEQDCEIAKEHFENYSIQNKIECKINFAKGDYINYIKQQKENNLK